MALVKINGIEFAVQFGASTECVEMDLACVVDGKFRHFDCLVPHGLEDVDWKDDLPESHKRAAIVVLEQWLESGLFSKNSYDDNLRYSPSFRGYATLPNFGVGNVQGVNEVDRIAAQLKSESFGVILRNRDDVWYLTPAENKQLKKIRSAYINNNQAYIDSKAKEFTEWWTARVGTLGDCGDPMANILHAVAVKDETFEQSDVEKFAVAVYRYALEQFKLGRIPFLSCDYAPERELSTLLTVNNIENLAARMPWKTWLHLDFSDMPPIVSEVSASLRS